MPDSAFDAWVHQETASVPLRPLQFPSPSVTARAEADLSGGKIQVGLRGHGTNHRFILIQKRAEPRMSSA